jgi:hypothetical protein
MIPRQLVGLTILGLSCAVTFWRGQKPERIGVSVVAAGWLLTPLVEQRDSWLQPQYGIMTVDIVVLAAFIVLAFRYRRYWTIYAAAFQIAAILIHLAFLIDPRALYRAYYAESFAVGYLILGAILGGVLIEGRTPPRLQEPPPPSS